MGRFIGEEKLQAEAMVGFPKSINRVNERIHFILGFGASNAILVEGRESCFMIDALSGAEVAEEALEEIRRITSKPIKAIIYTHFQHPDHIGGGGVLAVEGCEVYARVADVKPYGKTELVQNIGRIRGGRQFGNSLTKEEAISAGAGPLVVNGTMNVRKPTTFFTQERLDLVLDGVPVQLIAAPGETDDQINVWLPEDKVLCSGDNYYKSWPNLYAIRGSQNRDIDTWINSLTQAISYEAEVLLPGHSQAIYGQGNVHAVLTNYRDAIQFVLESTLTGMNQGLSVAQLVEKVKLPPQWQELPYLQEYYGTVSWTVRAIYTAYLGWFDGNPTNLGLLPVKVEATKNLAIMGGAERVLEHALQALADEDEQWAAQLCDILINGEEKVAEAKACKAKALVNLGRLQTSANGRHYYLSAAKELI